MSDHYILNDKHEAVPADLMTWARWFETADRHVSLTELGGVSVSTVFVGLDLGNGAGRAPLLFETMIFGGELNEECWRYSTWNEAAKHHAEIVNALKAGTTPPDPSSSGTPSGPGSPASSS